MVGTTITAIGWARTWARCDQRVSTIRRTGHVPPEKVFGRHCKILVNALSLLGKHFHVCPDIALTLQIRLTDAFGLGLRPGAASLGVTVAYGEQQGRTGLWFAAKKAVASRFSAPAN